MEIANVRVRLNKVGSDVPILDVTPAEALLLHMLHQSNNGGSTFGEDMNKIEIAGEAKSPGKVPDEVEPDKKIAAVAQIGQPSQPGFVAAQPEKVVKGKVLSYKDALVPRTDAQELNRLKKKYGHLVNKKGDKIIGLIWPGVNPQLPQKFSDLKWSEITYDGSEIGSLNYATGDLAKTA